MSITEDLATNAPLEVKATVFAEYHNDREVAYKAVENYCNDNLIYSDGSIAKVMEMIYENVSFNVAFEVEG
jgi:hypothetical protein